MKVWFLLFAVCAVSCYAKSVYVDFEAGDDAHKGMSPGTAWKHCPGDTAASGLARARLLGAGDTVFFKGGAVYRGSIALRWSGGAGGAVVYDGNSSGAWGRGTAILDGENARYYGFFSDERNISNVVIDDFEIRNLNYNAAAPWASGRGIFIDGGRWVTVSRCFVHDVGYWENDGSLMPSGCGIVFRKPTSCSALGCEVTKAGGAGIWFDGAQDCRIAGNRIHHYVNWGIDLSGGDRLCTRNTICDNTIYDLYLYDNGFWKGKDGPPHQDFIFIRMGTGLHPVRNVVERNLLYNNYAFTDFGGTAMVFLSYADSTLIRNNVLINAHSFCTAFFGWTSTGTKFYNNTVFCPRTSGVRLVTNGNNDIRNNIIICNPSAVFWENATDERNLIVDNNLYSMPNDNKSFAMVEPFTGWSFYSWQKRGFDTHSRLLPTVSGIKFVAASGYPLRCQEMNVHLQEGSPACKVGRRLLEAGRIARSAGLSADSAWYCGALGVAADSLVPSAKPVPEKSLPRKK